MKRCEQELRSSRLVLNRSRHNGAGDGGSGGSGGRSSSSSGSIDSGELEMGGGTAVCEQIMLAAFRYCVMDGCQNSAINSFNMMSCRRWVAKVVPKELLQWDEILGTNYTKKETDSNSRVIRRMRFDCASSGGDFITFFRWVVQNTGPPALAILESLRTIHSHFAVHEAAIQEATLRPITCPAFPIDINSARRWASQALKDQKCTRTRSYTRCKRIFHAQSCSYACACSAPDP